MELSSQKEETIVIIGGLSAGPAAAAKARRTNEKAKIILFEKGGNISYATCGMPYALSGHIPEEKNLIVVQASLLEKRFNIEMHLNEEVTEVNPELQTIKTPKGEYHYDKLMFATGANSFTPPIKNLTATHSYSSLRTLEDFRRIQSKGALEASQKVTILGGGLIGVETAENLIELGKEVTLIEGFDQILPQWSNKFAGYASDVLKNSGVKVLNGNFLTEVKVNDAGKMTHCVLGNGEVIETDYLIMSAGIRPNSKLLKEHGAETLPNGALIVNEYQETTLANIYAAGDVASTWNTQLEKADYIPLGTHSNKAGRVAGENIAGGNATYKGGNGTAIVQVFDFTLARTGLTEKQILENNIAHRKAYINAGSTPGYYGNAKNMVIELTYAPKTGKLLAAEAFGEKGVDKRIDVLSTAIYAGLSVEDLHELDLAYAPPFAPAKDPVVVAGYVAHNHVLGGCSPMSTQEVEQMITHGKPETYQLIDLRNPGEIQKSGALQSSINIPLDSIRDRISEVDNSKRVVVYCAKGMRGYLGVRMLRQLGFPEAINMAGGFSAWTLENRATIK